MMTKKELLKQCRYYHVEDRPPFAKSNLNWYWEMERV